MAKPWAAMFSTLVRLVEGAIALPAWPPAKLRVHGHTRRANLPTHALRQVLPCRKGNMQRK